MGIHGQTTSVNGVAYCHLVLSVDANSYQEIQKSISSMNRSTCADGAALLNSRYATENGNITEYEEQPEPDHAPKDSVGAVVRGDGIPRPR